MKLKFMNKVGLCAIIFKTFHFWVTKPFEFAIIFETFHIWVTKPFEFAIIFETFHFWVTKSFELSKNIPQIEHNQLKIWRILSHRSLISKKVELRNKISS